MLVSSSFIRKNISILKSNKYFINSVLKMSSGTSGSGAIKVLVPIANGSEEIESVTIIDTLVRGGCLVTVASVEDSLQVICSRGVKLVADKLIAECLNDEFDLIACPGGMPGAERLRDSKDLTALLQSQNSSGKLCAAICAAPAVIFSQIGILGDKSATCYPAPKFQNMISNLQNQNVVISGNVVTSKGPGTSLEFSLALIELLVSKEKSDAVAKEMLVNQ